MPNMASLFYRIILDGKGLVSTARRTYCNENQSCHRLRHRAAFFEIHRQRPKKMALKARHWETIRCSWDSAKSGHAIWCKSWVLSSNLEGISKGHSNRRNHRTATCGMPCSESHLLPRSMRISKHWRETLQSTCLVWFSRQGIWRAAWNFMYCTQRLLMIMLRIQTTRQSTCTTLINPSV